MVQEVDGQGIFYKFLSDLTRANPDILAAHFAPDADFCGTHSRGLVKGGYEIRRYFSASENGDPQVWLANILSRITQHKIIKLDTLRPWSHTAKSAQLAKAITVAYAGPA